ncbi:EAL domain-containing protein [Hoeflea sp. AS60]|uniref:EAL domain-containing protein n=1 Tax=Hoeflea sp. AS60 TaxID=3135780 RepID=UPI003172C4D9
MLKNFFTGGIDSPQAIQTALEAIRKHLNMEVAYVARIEGDTAVFEAVDAADPATPIRPGVFMNLNDIYCGHILAGRLPELIPDTADYGLAMSIPISRLAPVGAHIGVPITSASGETLGMFCCLSQGAQPTLNQRDLEIMHVFADLVGSQIISEVKNDRRLEHNRALIEAVLDEESYRCVFQPIVNLSTRRVTGFESLCRFSSEPYVSPDKWFADAHAAGLGSRLELAVIKTALGALDQLPNDVYLSVNASPSTIIKGGIEAFIDKATGSRLVLEVTEHDAVSNYQTLSEALAPLRKLGVRLAIDDAGAGYASMHHILSLAPDAIKLDMTLTRDIDSDAARRALASALLFFSRETNSVIIAEGIETEAEMATLNLLGVPFGQGYLLGKPAGLSAALEMSLGPKLEVAISA